MTEAESLPDRVRLTNSVFTRLGPAMFRRAEDGTPVMMVPMGDRQASLPIRAVQREFGIADDSPDGLVLALVVQSLDYVAGLHPGDLLPAEVLTGEASWSPEPRHRRIAEARLRVGLIRWINPAAQSGDVDGTTLQQMEAEPAMRAAVQSAFERAAAELGVGSPHEVLALVGQSAEELAYIEALRESLLERVQSLCGRIGTIGSGFRGNAERQATLTQVRRLARVALQQLAARFAMVDAHSADVLGVLRDPDTQRAFVRGHRDWLYRSRRAWEPILAAWDGAAPGFDESVWLRVGRTYQFLAPRFMPLQEWELATAFRPRRSAAAHLSSVMAW
jgi:hypothetical protein